jgi:hypothetical protein
MGRANLWTARVDYGIRDRAEEWAAADKPKRERMINEIYEREHVTDEPLRVRVREALDNEPPEERARIIAEFDYIADGSMYVEAARFGLSEH